MPYSVWARLRAITHSRSPIRCSTSRPIDPENCLPIKGSRGTVIPTSRMDRTSEYDRHSIINMQRFRIVNTWRFFFSNFWLGRSEGWILWRWRQGQVRVPDGIHRHHTFLGHDRISGQARGKWQAHPCLGGHQMGELVPWLRLRGSKLVIFPNSDFLQLIT